jgi:hypothetical protein
VIDEHGHQLVARGVDARDVPGPLRDDDALAGRERPGAHEVLDHPALASVAEVGAGQRLGRLAALGEHHDEVLGLPEHGAARERGREPALDGLERRARAQQQGRGDDDGGRHRRNPTTS